MAMGRLINYKWMKFYATIAAPPKVVHHSFAYTENSVIDISMYFLTNFIRLTSSLVHFFPPNFYLSGEEWLSESNVCSKQKWQSSAQQALN